MSVYILLDCKINLLRLANNMCAHTYLKNKTETIDYERINNIVMLNNIFWMKGQLFKSTTAKTNRHIPQIPLISPYEY